MKPIRNNSILIFGAGSIGERHLQVLLKMGCTNLYVYRQRGLPLRTVSENRVHSLFDIKQIDRVRPWFAIICTPTSQHLDQALLCARKGIPVLVEKPLTTGQFDLNVLKDQITSNSLLIRIAYMLRFHPFFEQIQYWINTNTFGKLLSAQSYWGEYLPHWHPWEDYRTSYAARKDLGGGAGLTLSHDLALLIDLFPGHPIDSSVQYNFGSGLEIKVDSAADISLRFSDGSTAHSHVNFHERIARRFYRFAFEQASIEIDYLQSEMKVFHATGQIQMEKIRDFNRDDLYTAQLLHFINGLSLSPAERIQESLSEITRSETLMKILSDQLFPY